MAAEVNERGEVTLRDQRLVRDLRTFAKQWDGNIKDQGFLEVFESQNAKPNPIAQ